MKLTHLRIQNFRSCRNVSLELGGMHALVGASNAGKSSVLRALDFLFNPSIKSLNEESFWNKDTDLEIRVEAVFSDLTDKEKEAFGAYLNPDGTFHMARSAKLGAKSGEPESDAEQGDDKIVIGQHYKKSMPEPEWLQESSIKGQSITKWWENKEHSLPAVSALPTHGEAQAQNPASRTGKERRTSLCQPTLTRFP